MKKIKYGNRKNEPQSKQLDNLKQGDEICEAVLDTLSDDYLNYITHLVKNSKTPIKQTYLQAKQRDDSDQEIEAREQQQTLHKVKHNPSKGDSRVRHHSQSGTRQGSSSVAKQKIQRKIGKGVQQDPARKLNYKSKQLGLKEQIQQKKGKRGDYAMERQLKSMELQLKNEQKTMSFTRNKQNPSSGKRIEEQTRGWGEMQKQLKLAKPKYYTTYHQQEDQNEKISINDDLMAERRHSQRENIENTFISEIDNYITNLQSNPRKQEPRSTYYRGKDRPAKESTSIIDKMRALGRHEKSKHREIQEEEFQYNLQQILKQNLKLTKKVKSYEQKVQELEDEISSHLIQCKNRQKNYKSKIADLIKALTQSISKINSQKSQIVTMKTLLRSFGQKFKQIQNQNEESDDDISEDISEQINRYMVPSRHSSQLRTKYKRGLESTMPKHEQQRKFWKQ